jgi:DNA-binding response OmpR family regulator
VVDDEEPMREFLAGVLTVEGHQVRLAADGPAACAAMDRELPDVVVLDMRLPGMSGEEVLLRLRQQWPSVAVIVMTGYPSEEAVIRSMSLGAVRFLIKPFAVDEFLRGVTGAAQERRNGDLVREGLTVQGGFRDWVELTAPSRQEYLDRFANFMDALYNARLDPGEREDIKIAVNEITANAMEWGNRQDQRRRVKVSYCLFPEEVVFKVEDEGEGFSPQQVPDPVSNPVGHLIERVRTGKRVGGYGIHIVRKVMDKVVYSEKGNVVILSKYLSGGQRSSAVERRSGHNG